MTSLITMIKTFTVPTFTKLVLGGGVAGLLGIAALGSTTAPALAATTLTAATSANTAKQHPNDRRQDHRQVARVIFEAEADVLGITPAQLRADLKQGKSVSELAQAKGMSKDQFADRLATAAKPGLDKLVDSKQITADQEQQVLASIRAGHIPFRDRHDRKAKA